NPINTVQVDSLQSCSLNNFQKFSIKSNINNPKDYLKIKQWFVNDTLSDTSSVFIKTNSNIGQKKIKLFIQTNSGCADTVYYSYYINPNPISKFTISDSVPCFFENKITIKDTGS